MVIINLNVNVNELIGINYIVIVYGFFVCGMLKLRVKRPLLSTLFQAKRMGS